MKKLHLLLLVSALAFAFTGCKMDADKAETKLDEATQNTISQVQALHDSPFRTSVEGLFYIPAVPFDKSKKISAEDIYQVKDLGINIRNSLLKNFPKIFDKKLGSSEFKLSDYAGTYTYNATDTAWDYSTSPSDEVIIIFPSKGSSTNDCKLVFSKYQEVKVSEDYLPSVIYVELYQNDKLIGKIDFTSDYNTYEVPKNMNVSILIAPIKFNLKYKFEKQVMNIDFAIKKGLRVLDALDGEFTFSDDELSDLNYAKGVFKTYKIDNAVNTGVLLKIKFDIDFQSAENVEECSEINQFVNIELYSSSDRLLGKVICDDDADCDDSDAVIQFNDGSEKCVSYYTDQIVDAILNIFSEEAEDLD